MATKTSFADYAAEESKNMLSRRWGGKTAVAEPAVNGYHFIRFTQLPDDLSKYVDLANISDILSASCLSVTPPGGTLSKVEFTGLGGVKWAVPGSLDMGTSVSIKFLEFSGLPILQIMHGWIKMMRDYRTGMGNVGNKYTKTNYASTLFYWTTTPNVQEIEYCACYDGVFPLKDPQDLFTSDVESVGRIDSEIEFNVDYVWHGEDWVFNKCGGFADTAYSHADIVNVYGSNYG